MQEYQKEIQIIENLSKLQIQEIIFDNQIHNWKQGESEFDSLIVNKKNICILIEDEENNIFGEVITQPIQQYSYFENGQIKGYSNSDERAFLFSLQSNGRIKEPMKFEIDYSKRANAFWLFPKDDKQLFGIGGCDIIINKEEYKNECCCFQFTFQYKQYKDVLIGKQGKTNPFTVKRILVFQMIETEEQLMERYFKEMTEMEMSLLNEKYSEITEMYNQDICQLEEWSSSEFQYVVFDSSFCHWEQFISTFDKHVMGLKELVFYIEDENDNDFGAYISTPISNHWNSSLSTEIQQNQIDKNAFVFSLKSNERLSQPTKFDIIPYYSPYPFNLFSGDDWILFSVGGNDIVVSKKDSNIPCVCKQSYFNYQEHENILTGNNQFTIKRFQVWKMKSKQQIHEEERMSIVEIENDIIKVNKEQILKSFEKEINQVKEWNGKEVESILFDSDFCEWKQNESTLLYHMNYCNHNPIVFIQTETNVVCGMYLCVSLIDNIPTIEDVYLFTFNENKPCKFQMKDEFKELMKHTISFYIMDETDEKLCILGNNEIIVKKKGMKCICNQNDDSFFDYKDQKNALLGKEGEFDVKRIVVFQFK